MSRVRVFFAAYLFCGMFDEWFAIKRRKTFGKLKDAAMGALVGVGISYNTTTLTLETSFVLLRFILNDPDGNLWGE